jgi:Holliday junction resolvase
MILESKIQAKLIKEYESIGYYVIKLIKTNKNGIPDLLCLKDGKGFFIEVKSEKGKLKPLQEYRHEELLKYGFETIIKRL